VGIGFEHERAPPRAGLELDLDASHLAQSGGRAKAGLRVARRCAGAATWS
jgi:hypothetical protein